MAVFHRGFELNLTRGPYRIFSESARQSFHHPEARHLAVGRQQNLQGNETLDAIASSRARILGLGFFGYLGAFVGFLRRDYSLSRNGVINDSRQAAIIRATVILVFLGSNWRRLVLLDPG